MKKSGYTEFKAWRLDSQRPAGKVFALTPRKQGRTFNTISTMASKVSISIMEPVLYNQNNINILAFLFIILFYFEVFIGKLSMPINQCQGNFFLHGVGPREYIIIIKSIV